MANLDARCVRDEIAAAADSHNLTPKQVRRILSLNDETIETWITETTSRSDFFWSAFDDVRRETITRLAELVTTLPKAERKALCRPNRVESTFTREQLLDAAASETVSFRIGEPEVERAQLAGMSALIAQLTVGEGSFTDVQNETRAEIERRAIAQGAPYSL